MKKVILSPISILYGLIIKLRNILYNKRLLKVNRLPCKVVSVGNITMGGTGKTPIVIYLSNLLKNDCMVPLAKGSFFVIPQASCLSLL